MMRSKSRSVVFSRISQCLETSFFRFPADSQSISAVRDEESVQPHTSHDSLVDVPSDDRPLERLVGNLQVERVTDRHRRRQRAVDALLADILHNVSIIGLRFFLSFFIYLFIYFFFFFFLLLFSFLQHDTIRHGCLHWSGCWRRARSRGRTAAGWERSCGPSGPPGGCPRWRGR